MEWVPLPPAINPLAAVRRTTSEVMERAVHVTLDEVRIEQLAKMWATDGGAGGANIGWNETGWHYSEDAAAGGTLTCQYVFVLGENSHLNVQVLLDVGLTMKSKLNVDFFHQTEDMCV